MGWRVIKRKLGRAGGLKERSARQRDWDRRYGEGMWCVGYVVDGEFVTGEDALEEIYQRSYEVHFEQHPEDLEELCAMARTLRNPHAEATTGVDLQVPAILEHLRRQGRALEGAEVVDIGSYQGEASHAISIRLSPLQIKAWLRPKSTLEGYWQSRKCLAVWED